MPAVAGGQLYPGPFRGGLYAQPPGGGSLPQPAGHPGATAAGPCAGEFFDCGAAYDRQYPADRCFGRHPARHDARPSSLPPGGHRAGPAGLVCHGLCHYCYGVPGGYAGWFHFRYLPVLRHLFISAAGAVPDPYGDVPKLPRRLGLRDEVENLLHPDAGPYDDRELFGLWSMAVRGAGHLAGWRGTAAVGRGTAVSAPPQRARGKPLPGGHCRRGVPLCGHLCGRFGVWCAVWCHNGGG